MKYEDLKNERYLMFIDTETIGTLNIKESVYPFEIGMKVLDTQTNKIVKEKSYLVRKFFNNKFVMLSTFSASKYPTYFEKLESDKRYNVYSPNAISQDIQKVMTKYKIKLMVAHNGNFDKTAIARLFEEFGVANPFDNVLLLDTMMLSFPLTKSKEYEDFCIQNQDRKNSMGDSAFITNSGRVRTTAQAIYCYLSNDIDFEEAHTGLEDIDIEIVIFQQTIDLWKEYKYLGCLNFVPLEQAPTWRDYKKVIES